ncbi:meiosis 1 arrest protein-like [Mya arenaria]|uniref:meiosis 1 arrest protein-like n=1 Tax=Mya arenaria TaxID=6604 RepID=UPI0022E42F14|nr:meiosis 1 arrest protein-like [Mya arenaria]
MVDKQRTLLGKQPARLLLVDASHHRMCDAGIDVCTALDNVLSLACNFNGPTRIPFLSIMCLQKHPEMLLPFSYVRNNYTRLQAAVSDLRIRLDGHVTRPSEVLPSYFQALAEACTQYQRQIQSATQSSGFCHQLEIILLTCQSSRLVQKGVDMALTSIDTDSLKSIQVVCLSGASLFGEEDIFAYGSQSSESLSDPSSESSLNSLIEVNTIQPDLLCLQNLFMGWLTDSSTDSEHLHILLPAPQYSCTNTYSAESCLTIKCDIHERILQPAQLPSYCQFSLHADSSLMKVVFPSTSKAVGLKIPVHRLKVQAILPVSHICDSVVFGMPMIANATSCWRIDWDELERNQQLFYTLSHTLASQEQALLAKLLPPEPTQGHGRTVRGSTSPESQPCGHFVLVPSGSGTLLVKAVATKELMLPHKAGRQMEEPVQECMEKICSSLDQLVALEAYNPLQHSSDIFESLKCCGKKPGPQRQKRPLDESPHPVASKVSVKGGRNLKKQPVVQSTSSIEHDPLADTPPSERIENRTGMKLPRRALYTQPHTMFTAETWEPPNSHSADKIGSSRYRQASLNFPSEL